MFLAYYLDLRHFQASCFLNSCFLEKKKKRVRHKLPMEFLVNTLFHYKFHYKSGSFFVIIAIFFHLVSRSYPASPASSTASSNPPSPGSKDSLSQLSALIRKGEKKGLFAENMPPYVKKNVSFVF